MKKRRKKKKEGQRGTQGFTSGENRAALLTRLMIGLSCACHQNQNPNQKYFTYPEGNSVCNMS